MHQLVDDDESGFELSSHRHGSQLLYGGMGGIPENGAKFYEKGQRQRVNVVSAYLGLCVPWLVHCLIHGLLSFQWHYHHPFLCAVFVDCGLVCLLLCSVHAVWRKLSHGRLAAPTWYTLIILTSLFGWILGAVFGNLNFRVNMEPYYGYQVLNEYFDVNPSLAKGSAFMDGGRMHFSNTSVLDLRRSMGFKNVDTYCVAPITVTMDGSSPWTQAMPLDHYDFWAVGLGCCSSEQADFHCGEFDNPKAHGGLRLLDDTQRDFFRLAVQQAEATYGIKATHPLFFYWTRSPVKEMNSFRDEGYKYYAIGMLTHFAWQALVVFLVLLALSQYRVC